MEPIARRVAGDRLRDAAGVIVERRVEVGGEKLDPQMAPSWGRDYSTAECPRAGIMAPSRTYTGTTSKVAAVVIVWPPLYRVRRLL